MQLPLSLSKYSALPLSMDSGVAAVGFLVLSASAGSSHVFFEKSSLAAAPGGVIERLSFWFLFVVVELFAFCADDVIAIPNELRTSIETVSNNENRRTEIIDFRIDFSFLIFISSFSWHRLF